MNFAISSYASGMKKALDGCERELLVKRGGDERFWVWVWFLGGTWGGGGRQSVCGFVSFSRRDAVSKYGARIWVIFNIICCGGMWLRVRYPGWAGMGVIWSVSLVFKGKGIAGFPGFCPGSGVSCECPLVSDS